MVIIWSADPCNLSGGRKFTEESFDVSRFAFIDLGLPSGTCWGLGVLPGRYTKEEAVSLFGKYLPTEKDFDELCAHCRFEDFFGFPAGPGPVLIGRDGVAVRTGDGRLYMEECLVGGPQKGRECIRAVSGRNGAFVIFNDDRMDGVDYWLLPDGEDAVNCYCFRGPESFSPINPGTMISSGKRAVHSVKLVFRP